MKLKAAQGKVSLKEEKENDRACAHHVHVWIESLNFSYWCQQMSTMTSATLSSVSFTCDHVNFDLGHVKRAHAHAPAKGRQYFLKNKGEETFPTGKAERYISTQHNVNFSFLVLLLPSHAQELAKPQTQQPCIIPTAGKRDFGGVSPLLVLCCPAL